MTTNQFPVLFTYQDMLKEDETSDEPKSTLGKFTINDIQDFMLKGGTQWSQIIAWLWLPDTKRPDQGLKQALNEALRNQALYSRYNFYSEEADEWSAKITSLLKGEEVEGVKGKRLPEIYKDLTGKEDYVFNHEIMELFYFQITADSFQGYMSRYDYRKKKFIIVIGHPPRPDLDETNASVEFNLSKDTLESWSQNHDEDYYKNRPPSPYIPVWC